MGTFGRALLALLGGLLLAESVAEPAAAREMKPTIYDDGRACPGNCDAHVVLHPSDNGTRYASLPSSSRSAPRACVNGQPCRICFGEADDTCMVVLYRGGGPPVGRFDFTPAFYAEHCGKPGIPAALARHCGELDAAAMRSGYATRINCLAHRDHSLCQGFLAEAEARRQADLPKLKQCLDMGQDAYNRQQSDPRERRANDCNYSDQRLGRNTKGVTWRLLLPGACREGTYVGQFGTDCCSADARFAAHVHPECRIFFPQP